MQLELKLPYLSSLSLSPRAKLWLGILAGLSFSILAAGYLLNRRRRRYRAISTTSSDSGSRSSLLQRMSTFRSADPPPTPFHSVNSAHSAPRLRRPVERSSAATLSPESDSSLYSSAGEEVAFFSAREEPSSSGPSAQEHRALPNGFSSSSSSSSSSFKQPAAASSEDHDGGVTSALQQQQGDETTVAMVTLPPLSVVQESDETGQGYESDSSSASFHSTLTTPPPSILLLPSSDHVTLERNHLYNAAMELVNGGGITCRNIRTKMLGCTSDEDFLAKLHCVRLAFDKLLASAKRDYMVQVCRDIMTSFLRKMEQDPGPFCECYDDLEVFLSDEANKKVAERELTKRKVACMNVYDVALDFILLDAFDDMDTPPSTVMAVLHNRWITDGMKKGALSAAIWSILKAKHSILSNKNGFMSRFYAMSQVLSPTLAWGFMGTDTDLRAKCMAFRDGVMELVCGMFSLDHARYTTVETLSEDIFVLAQEVAAKMTNDHA